MSKINEEMGPFENAGEYPDLEFRWLLARSARIGAEARVREAERLLPAWNARTVGDTGPEVGVEETRRRHEALTDEERRLREQIDRRLEAHRADTSREPLGLDILSEAHGRDRDDRTILLLGTAAAVSGKLSDEILEPLGGGYGGPTVETAIRLIHPVGRAADWLAARERFHRTGPMVKGGLIAVSYPHTECSSPASLMQATVELTAEGFSAITGVPESDDEEDGDSPSR